jgi:hypothetical protein
MAICGQIVKSQSGNDDLSVFQKEWIDFTIIATRVIQYDDE